MLTILFAVFLVASAYDYDEVSRKCITENEKPLPNDFLLGTWYKIYEFGATSIETDYCATMEFSKPTTKNLEEYKKKYNITGMPFNFEGSPVELKDSRVRGLVMGDAEMKHYVLDPKEVMVIRGVFKLYVFKRLSDKYIVFFACEMRGNLLWLLSRDKHPPVNETDSLINTTPIFKNKVVGRYCVDERKPYPLVSGGRYCSCHCCSV